VLLDRLELQRAGMSNAPRHHAADRVTHLQAGLQDFDEAADLVCDLGARRAELGRADDLHNWSRSKREGGVGRGGEGRGGEGRGGEGRGGEGRRGEGRVY
jgi:hypothetical protein